MFVKPIPADLTPGHGQADRYLQEGLLAILPVYDGRHRAMVLTAALIYLEERTPDWLLNQIAAYYSLDLAALRRHCREAIGRNSNLPLPFSEDLVLLPARVRRPYTAGESVTGHISIYRVSKIGGPAEVNAFAEKEIATGLQKSPPQQKAYTGQASGQELPGGKFRGAGKSSPFLSVITFDTGLKLGTHHTPQTLRENMHLAHLAHCDFMVRQNFGPHAGLKKSAIKAALPNCDCILLELFTGLLRIGQPVEPGPGRSDYAPLWPYLGTAGLPSNLKKTPG